MSRDYGGIEYVDRRRALGAEAEMYRAIVRYLEFFEHEIQSPLTVDIIANAAVAVVTGEAELPKGWA